MRGAAHGFPCADADLHTSVPVTVELRMVDLADTLPTAIAALSELAGRGDSAFGEAGHLAAVAGEAGRARDLYDSELRPQDIEEPTTLR